MINTKIKIPTKHYCGMQKRGDDDLPLGFITPYGTDQAAKNRIDTVDKWARGWRGNNNLPATVLNNTPMAGFKLSDTIKRTSSWGRGNVVWRIDDPRGFELEITNNNLMQIMLCAMVVDAEIICPCVWGREGAENVLIPTDSQLYKDAMLNTERQKKTVSTRDVKPGNTIVLQNGVKGKYLGAFFIIKASNTTSEALPELNTEIALKKKHFILTKSPEGTWRVSKECILSLASLKIAEITNTNLELLSDSQRFINNIINNSDIDVADGQWSLMSGVIGVSADNKILPVQVLKEVPDVCAYSAQFPTYSKRKHLIGDLPNEVVITSTIFINEAIKVNNLHQQHTADIINRNELELNNIIRKEYVKQPTKSGGGYYMSQYDYHVVATVDLKAAIPLAKKWYTISYKFTDTVTTEEIELQF